MKEKKFIIFLFLISFLARLFYICVFPQPPVSGDSNSYNKQEYSKKAELARILVDFQAELVFYPSSRQFLCLIKDDTLFIIKNTYCSIVKEEIMTEDRFIIQNPTFIKTLLEDPNFYVGKEYILLE